MPDEKIANETPQDYDTWSCFNYGIPYGLYLYYLDDSRFSTDNTSILGNSSAIQSIQYTPFLDPADLILDRIPYDVDRFGSISKLRPGMTVKPDVFRIVSIKDDIKVLGQFDTYKIEGQTIGGKRNWRNESKLYQYPYQFMLLTDHLNPPMTIKPHLCPRLFKQTIKVRNTISDRCSYGLYIDGYKGDTNGSMEALVSTDAHELPCSSSAYSQWFATSKNQTQFSANQGIKESFLQQAQVNQSANLQSNMAMINGVVGGIGSLLSGNIGGAIGSVMGMATTGMQTNLAKTQASQSGALHRQGITGALLAQQRDLQSTPNTLISMGSDIIYGLKKGAKKVSLYRYGLTEEFFQRLGDYFAMYGYKQNKIMPLGSIINTRYYYNYIKTVGANIMGSDVPKSHLDEFKEIFNNGVTIWHFSNADVYVSDYSKDNYEVDL